MTAPETILRQGKTMGKGKSVETLRRTAAKNNKLPGTKTAATAAAAGKHKLASGRRI
ncbi:MAG TPA: hypothetical protein O0X70_01535 [Methanocorpusculum sp.]|nr:hypothetical protein [Methanocorpusculum sp.]